jgi:hypothetical protein
VKSQTPVLTDAQVATKPFDDGSERTDSGLKAVTSDSLTPAPFRCDPRDLATCGDGFPDLERGTAVTVGHEQQPCASNGTQRI